MAGLIFGLNAVALSCAVFNMNSFQEDFGSAKFLVSAFVYNFLQSYAIAVYFAKSTPDLSAC